MISNKKKPGKKPGYRYGVSRFRQNLQRGTLTARQWEEEMRAGDDVHMKGSKVLFNLDFRIAAMHVLHGF